VDCSICNTLRFTLRTRINLSLYAPKDPQQRERFLGSFGLLVDSLTLSRISSRLHLRCTLLCARSQIRHCTSSCRGGWVA
jgi:hypothetical protein